MTRLFPHLATAAAQTELRRLVEGAQPRSPSSEVEHTWAAVGTPISVGELNVLRSDVLATAARYGFPERAGNSERVEFDRAVTPVIRSRVDVTHAEAANRAVWSYLALVVLPEVTEWRFSTRTAERWIGSDLTRHTWGRLWWQAEAFAARPELLGLLSEGDLNQLFERRTIGGDPRLVVALAETVLDVDPAARRATVRESSKRLRRMLAFLDTAALSAEDLRSLCATVVLGADRSELEPQPRSDAEARVDNGRRHPGDAGPALPSTRPILNLFRRSKQAGTVEVSAPLA